ncbi:MAG TPA: hypothetical protein VGR35_13965 [Tepidisphaeraceae bacterium]|nr:hypothetical protein [Tepidisphaeraceae bacterium]
MSFELHVGDSPEPYRVTYNLYHLVSLVLHREFDFPHHLRMFTRAAAEFDPLEVLREAEILKDMAKGHHRPYIDVGRPLERIDLEGLLHFPQLLSPEGQIVKDWGHFVNFDDDNIGFVATAPTLVAGRGRLHLVDAIATDVADALQWTGFEHITAQTFEWTGGQLLADGVPCVQVPDEYLRPNGTWQTVTFAKIPVYLAWADELDELTRACQDALARKVMIRTKLD